MLVQNLVSSIM